MGYWPAMRSVKRHGDDNGPYWFWFRNEFNCETSIYRIVVYIYYLLWWYTVVWCWFSVVEVVRFELSRNQSSSNSFWTFHFWDVLISYSTIHMTWLTMVYSCVVLFLGTWGGPVRIKSKLSESGGEIVKPTNRFFCELSVVGFSLETNFFCGSRVRIAWHTHKVCHLIVPWTSGRYSMSKRG
jgi:hypothetical protein